MLSLFMLKNNSSGAHSGNRTPTDIVSSTMRWLALVLSFIGGAVIAQDTWKDVYSEKAWIDRDRWQKPQELLRQLNLKAGSQVADVGCHEGYLTMKLAKSVGSTGKVCGRH